MNRWICRFLLATGIIFSVTLPSWTMDQDMDRTRERDLLQLDKGMDQRMQPGGGGKGGGK